MLATVVLCIAVAVSSVAGVEKCRMTITGSQVFALKHSSFNSTSYDAVIMKFDLLDDPKEKNKAMPWLGGFDPYGLTAYDYTRPAGCLGVNGPLGYAGPLGSTGKLPTRYHGTTPADSTRKWSNGWCNVPAGKDDKSCVYGSAGALGEAGPVTSHAYYYDMYHLGEGKYWFQDYNINLDSSGIWGIQGPLGPTGALGALGPLGPLGISLQPGVTTASSGVYSAEGVGVVRATAALRFAKNSSLLRQYDLFEFYSRDFALKMGADSSAPENDCSFAVDSYLKNPSRSGDTYRFSSKMSQWVSVNVVPINLFDTFSVTVLRSTDRGKTYTSTVASSTSNPYQAGGIMNFVVYRALPNEKFAVVVKQLANGAPVESGYYLYVTGSGFLQGTSPVSMSAVDLFDPRQQRNGNQQFNVLGPHQKCDPW